MIIALLGFAVLLGLSFVGFPLGFATLAVGITGFAFTRGWDWHAAFTMMSQQIVETGGSYGLSVIPLFILMGVFIHRAKISEDLYKASYAWSAVTPAASRNRRSWPVPASRPCPDRRSRPPRRWPRWRCRTCAPTATTIRCPRAWSRPAAHSAS